MRIAIDVRSLMEGQVSGIGQYTKQIVRAMVKTAPEHEYHLFYNSASHITLPDVGPVTSVQALRYPNKIFNALQWGISWPTWDALLPAVDVVFAPSLRLVPLSVKIPLVSVVHDLSYERFPELFDARRRVWHKMMKPQKLAQRSDAIIAVSEHTKQDIVSLYAIPEEKVRVVYSGVEVQNFPAGPAVPKLPKHFILYLGTLEPRKNVDSLVRAYSAIADKVEQDLVIAGAKGWSYGEVENAIRGSAYASRIHLLGFVPEEEKAALYGAADLFVYPSLYEGFGFPPLEALLSGTPVITSFNSALPEVVGQWATLINPYDVGELALVLQELLHHLPAVPAEVRAKIAERYSWEAAARATLGVLAQVA